MKEEVYRVLGMILILYTITFQFTLTSHFGGNLFPETTEELLCDITTIILMVVSVMLTNYKDKTN